MYVLVRHAAVPFEVRDGRTFVKVEGTVVTVTSPDVDVLVPVKVTGVGAKPWYAVVKNGTWSRDFGVAAKSAKVLVTNLATGR